MEKMMKKDKKGGLRYSCEQTQAIDVTGCDPVVAQEL